jgi:hypothetical protein
MGEAQGTLLSLAEIAIVLAGFSAIVVVLKRGVEGKWSALHADQFNGMVVHAIFAVTFCLLPMLLNIFVQDSSTTLHILCGMLGAQILGHSLGVMFFQTTSKSARFSLAFGVVVGATQFLVFTDWGVQREYEIYLTGIVWHIIQAGLLFVMLVWISAGMIEEASKEVESDR